MRVFEEITVYFSYNLISYYERKEKNSFNLNTPLNTINKDILINNINFIIEINAIKHYVNLDSIQPTR